MAKAMKKKAWGRPPLEAVITCWCGGRFRKAKAKDRQVRKRLCRHHYNEHLAQQRQNSIAALQKLNANSKRQAVVASHRPMFKETLKNGRFTKPQVIAVVKVNHWVNSGLHISQDHHAKFRTDLATVSTCQLLLRRQLWKRHGRKRSMNLSPKSEYVLFVGATNPETRSRHYANHGRRYWTQAIAGRALAAIRLSWIQGAREAAKSFPLRSDTGIVGQVKQIIRGGKRGGRDRFARSSVITRLAPVLGADAFRVEPLTGKLHPLATHLWDAVRQKARNPIHCSIGDPHWEDAADVLEKLWRN